MNDSPSSARENWISASEVGRYLYCRRAWWLQRVKGWAPQNRDVLERGTLQHRQYVETARIMRQTLRRMWQLAFLAALVALGLAFTIVLAQR
ncbi:MAG: hypothetical protein H5T69_01820 [Chloroflexi bacterium]|nr:hypothetical protein [Chloroflexota bacterium]